MNEEELQAEKEQIRNTLKSVYSYSDEQIDEAIREFEKCRGVDYYFFMTHCFFNPN